MAIYIYTIPKAGTYFLAELLGMLGFHNTGYHVSRRSYLDTRNHSLEENARTPSVARVNQFFVRTLRRLEDRDVAFGHFPAPLYPQIFARQPKFICSYRAPRETLVSEFIDFRFRRSDVDWIAPSAIEDDGTAFVRYLEAHGVTNHAGIFKSMLQYQYFLMHPFVSEEERNNTLFVDFDALKASADEVSRIARFLSVDIDSDQSRSILQELLAAQTKTRSDDVRVRRETFWNQEAEALYAASEFPAICEMAVRYGWTI